MAQWMEEDEEDLDLPAPLVHTEQHGSEQAAVPAEPSSSPLPAAGLFLAVEDPAAPSAARRVSEWLAEDEDFMAELDAIPLPGAAPPTATAMAAAREGPSQGVEAVVGEQAPPAPTAAEGAAAVEEASTDALSPLSSPVLPSTTTATATASATALPSSSSSSSSSSSDLHLHLHRDDPFFGGTSDGEDEEAMEEAEGRKEGPVGGSNTVLLEAAPPPLEATEGVAAAQSLLIASSAAAEVTTLEREERRAVAIVGRLAKAQQGRREEEKELDSAWRRFADNNSSSNNNNNKDEEEAEAAVVALLQQQHQRPLTVVDRSALTFHQKDVSLSPQQAPSLPPVVELAGSMEAPEVPGDRALPRTGTGCPGIEGFPEVPEEGALPSHLGLLYGAGERARRRAEREAEWENLLRSEQGGAPSAAPPPAPGPSGSSPPLSMVDPPAPPPRSIGVLSFDSIRGEPRDDSIEAPPAPTTTSHMPTSHMPSEPTADMAMEGGRKKSALARRRVREGRAQRPSTSSPPSSSGAHRSMSIYGNNHPPPHRVGPIVHDSFSMRKQPKPATKRKRKAVARKQRKQGPPTPTSRALPFNHHHHHHHHHHHLQQRRTGGSLKQQRRQPASLRTKKLCLPRPSPPCTLPALGPTRLVLF